MSNTITFENTRWVINLQEKARKLLKTVYDFKETHKSYFMNCAVVYMSVKIGLILLATFTSMALLISYVSQQLVLEMTKTKSLLLASPLTVIIMLKLYFIFKMLMTYERSRVIIRSAIRVIWSKGKEGIQRVEGTLPVPPLSLEKAKNR
jgi:glycerol-3-phosphate acyltransferase PlsY